MTATPERTMSGVRARRAVEAPELHQSGAAGSDFGTVIYADNDAAR